MFEIALEESLSAPNRKKWLWLAFLAICGSLVARLIVLPKGPLAALASLAGRAAVLAIELTVAVALIAATTAALRIALVATGCRRQGSRTTSLV